MSVYKIFPTKDTTVYSVDKYANTGLDAILELSKGVFNSDRLSTSRTLLKFSDEEINSIFSNYIGTGSYSASLKMYLANAGGIPTDVSIEVRPLAEEWDMGTGQYGDISTNKSGASWFSNITGSAWSFPIGTTGSYLPGNQGGGSWHTGSVSTQSFEVYTEKDLNVNVTDIVRAHKQGIYVNNGFIVKNSQEFDPNQAYVLQYFSRDTHTIYPPCLELKWDDSVYSPISQSLICSNANINVSLQNNNFSYRDGSVSKVRINVRDKFPTRMFSTSSLYTNQKYLPSSSYWSVVDHKTEDSVFNFDEQFTKISADASGNYFTLYTEGLQPSRYYRFIIKSEINGEVLILDNDYIFKVE